ncbi:alpha-amylase-like [Acanthaster planci]|uniref:Alpha-amylase n=1 Tax=Acanthaster planci TaxID=133434 RepID=A0A8B7ZUZ4_ACAPL|nr:alpha-amylase-like [Acanthaster planci]
MQCNVYSRYLGPHGFGGVQISPPNEHRAIWQPWRPWWERYQPVSYKLTSRSGNEQQLRNMIQRCNDAGVRIYADAVINHMARGDSGYGIAQSWYDVEVLSYPGVPYTSSHFGSPNGECRSDSGNVEDFTDISQIRNCRLEGLPDLDASHDDVKSRITAYMNRLIDMGVAGFRVDAAKFIWPHDLGEILAKLKNLNETFFPRGSRPFIFQEVTNKGVNGKMWGQEYVAYGRVTEFKYGLKLGQAFSNPGNLSNIEILIGSLDMLPDSLALVFVDNHDNQRGHGGGQGVITFKEPRQYKMCNVFMLAYPYGITRIMSSFDFNDTEAGPPSDMKGHTLTVTVNKNGACEEGWVCEHRWRSIKNMVGFRNIAAGQPLTNWWNNGNRQIAFGRGDKAFVVINNEDYPLLQTLKTGLPSGEYCNIILGDFDPSMGLCSGPTIHIDGSSNAFFRVGTGNDSTAAIHVGAKVSKSGTRYPS